MASDEVCRLWHPGDCTGTSACPPRCPRYIAADGEPYTVRPRGWGERHLVMADAEGRECGWAYEPADGAPAHVEVADGVPADVATELLRQLVVRAYVRGLDRIRVCAPDDAMAALADELGDAVDRDDGLVDIRLEPAAIEGLVLAPARYAPVGAADALDALVAPESVAVIGATDRPGSIGRVLLENLTATFDGAVYPVHPTRETVLGIDAVASVTAVAPDLTVVAVPAEGVLDAVEDALAAGTGAIAILSAGFAETDAVGARRERALRDLVAEADVPVVGPNALGVVSTRTGLNASFAPTLPGAGGVSVVSHSGAMLTAILDWLAASGLGVRDAVSLGNGVGLDATALVRFWGRDPATTAILAYLEDLPEGRDFVEVARDVTPTTPVVAIKGGRSPAGARAAASHTGALVGGDAGYEAAFRAAGVVAVEGQQAALDVLQLLERQPRPTGDRIAIVTNAGGPGVLATDAVDRRGGTLAELDRATIARLEARLPAAASAANPVDVLGDADVTRIADALGTVLGDRGVDVAVVTTTPHPLIDPDELLAAIDEVASRYATPVAVCLGGREGVPTGETAVPVYPDVDRAVGALSTAARYARQRFGVRGPLESPPFAVDRVARLVDRHLSAGDTIGVEALDVLETAGVGTPGWALVRERDELASVTADLEGPFVLKAVVAEVAHKTDIGGVRTGVDRDDLATAYEELVAAVGSPAGVDAVVVQEAVPDGVEVLVGVTTHARFGPILTVGLGGVLVEQVGAVEHALAPVSPNEARELLARFDPIVDGPRGGEAPDLDALAEAVARIAYLGASLEGIETLEVNPVIATSEGAFAVDLLLARDAAI